MTPTPSKTTTTTTPTTRSSTSTTITSTPTHRISSTDFSNSSEFKNATTTVVTTPSRLDSTNDGAIAGGCSAAVIIVALSLIAIIVFLRRRKINSMSTAHHCRISEPEIISPSGIDKYENVNLQDIMQPPLSIHDIEATYLNGSILTKSPPSTEFSLSQNAQSSDLTNMTHQVSQSKDREQSLAIDYTSIRVKKPDFFLANTETNEAYTSLRSQTSECVNPYNTLQEFGENSEARATKPQNNIKPNGSNVSLINPQEIQQHKNLLGEKISSEKEEINTTYLNYNSNIAKLDLYENSLSTHSVGQKTAKGKPKATKEKKNEQISDKTKTESVLPRKLSAEDNDINVYKNDRVYNNY